LYPKQKHSSIIEILVADRPAVAARRIYYYILKICPIFDYIYIATSKHFPLQIFDDFDCHLYFHFPIEFVLFLSTQF